MSNTNSRNTMLLTQSETKVKDLEEVDALPEEKTELTQGTSFAKIDVNGESDPKKYSPKESVFLRTGYKVTSKIATTLQGSVYNAIGKDGDQCVLKRASVKLHDMGVAVVNNKLFKVSEDITNEAAIMKYLSSKNPPKGLIDFIDFFCDGKNYFLLMGNGGSSLFKHVTSMHELINKGLLSLKRWKQHVNILFKQMCVFVNWLHNVARLVHLDISMENMLIKGCIFEKGRFVNHGQINFIDFGLAKSYVGKKSFANCTKYVGKQSYQSPNVFSKKPFDASLADIWSLGVVLFMMTFGSCPYKKPILTDIMFTKVINNQIDKWAKYLNKQNYLSKNLLSLFSCMLCNEKRRWDIKKIIKHRYLK